MSNNGHEESEERRRKCPFSGAWCDKEACALWAEIGKNMGGMTRKMGMCSFAASNFLLSEINNKLAMQGRQTLPKIVLPGVKG